MAQCSEGATAFNSAWRELKTKGYLKQFRTSENHKFTYTYYLLYEPDSSEETTNFIASSSCDTEFEYEYGAIGSAPKETSDDKNCTYDDPDDVKEQIDYNTLIRERYSDKPIIDKVVETIADTLKSKRGKYIFNGGSIDAAKVKAQLKKLTKPHIEKVVASISKYYKKIRHLKAYLLVCLYKVSLEALPAATGHTAYTKPTCTAPASYDIRIYNDMLKNSRLAERYAYLFE